MRPSSGFRRLPLGLLLLGLAALGLWSVGRPASAAAPGPARELVFLTWADYMDPAVIADFERSRKVKVKRVFFEADDARDELMAQTEGRGFDVIDVNGPQVGPYRARGWLAPLEGEKIPNLRHLDPRWGKAFGAEGWGVAYVWGTVGIVYRKDLVRAPPTKWMDLYRPADKIRGKVAMIGNSRDSIGFALKALGYPYNSEEPNEIRAAEQLLLGQKPHVKSYSYISLGDQSELLTGEVSAAMAYNGDALVLQSKSPALGFSLPEEGTTIWLDYFAVASSSAKKDLAMDFINFLNEPKNAARNARFTNFATANKAAEKLLPASFFANRTIYPPKAVADRADFERKLSPRALKLRNEVFSRVAR